MSQCQELQKGNTHSPVCGLLKSISNGRTRKPRPLFVWDVEQVLKYIDSGQVNNGFNNKDTTLKTVALVDLCMFQRGSKVFQFDTKNVFGNDTEITLVKARQTHMLNYMSFFQIKNSVPRLL